MRLLFLLLLGAGPGGAQTTIESDAWILGDVGVGVSVADGQLEIKADALHPTVLRVSGVDETPFLIVGQDGRVGVSTNPAARLDVSGVADVGDVAVRLDAGDLIPDTSTHQMTLGYAGGASYRHGVRSRHADAIAGNAVEFSLWTPGSGGAAAIGDQNVLSLVTTSTNASVHVMPVGTPGYELVVSNGETPGAGTVSAASILEPSSREWKEGIRPLDAGAREKALREVAGLEHKAFRYKESPTRTRGLIYEESPPSIRVRGDNLSLNQRLVNAELAMQALIERLEGLEADRD